MDTLKYKYLDLEKIITYKIIKSYKFFDFLKT